MLAAGKLNKRVTIEQPVETRGADYGEPISTWETLATVWAAIEPLAGREYFANQQVQGSATARVRIRARDDVTEKMRIRYKDRILQIVEPPMNLMERGEEMHLMVEEFNRGEP